MKFFIPRCLASSLACHRGQKTGNQHFLYSQAEHIMYTSVTSDLNASPQSSERAGVEVGNECTLATNKGHLGTPYVPVCGTTESVDAAAHLITEDIDMGPGLGVHTFMQMDAAVFNDACKQEVDSADDCTGLRIHPGGSVFVRFLATHGAQWCSGRRVLELGCGTGLASVACMRSCSPALLVCTDGNPDCLDIARSNVHTLAPQAQQTLHTLATDGKEGEKSGSIREECVLVPMLWTPDAVAQMLATVQTIDDTVIVPAPAAPAPAPAPVEAAPAGAAEAGAAFDVAIGSELMYYMSDLPALCSVLASCLDPSRSCFLSAHVFRKDGQLDEWVTLIQTRLQWVTYEVALDSFIGEAELEAHPGWWNARMLVSGPASVLDPHAAAACAVADARATGTRTGGGRGVENEAWLDIRTKLERELRQEEEEEGDRFLALMGGG